MDEVAHQLAMAFGAADQGICWVNCHHKYYDNIFIENSRQDSNRHSACHSRKT